MRLDDGDWTDWKWMGLAAAAVMIVLLGASIFLFKSDFDNPRTTFIEEPLHKNTKLMIQPGEGYTYSYLYNNTEINVTYEVIEGWNCTIIHMVENRDAPGICVDKYGMDKGGANAAFTDPTILLYKPWMLAVDDSWHWNMSLYLTFNSTTAFMTSTDYRVLRTENYRGRKAFVVREKSTDSEPQYLWVDAEKRILLRMLGTDYDVILTKGLPIESVNRTTIASNG